MQSPSTESRKQSHINLSVHQDVESEGRYSGFSELRFVPQAFPELSLDELDLARNFLGRDFAAPLMITGMTGGVEQGTQINRRLAAAASRVGIPMGVGSQRIALEDSSKEDIFILKDRFPDLFLIGNIGMTLLREPNALEQAKRAVDMIQADALAVHGNVVQECVQPEGDRAFDGILKNLGQLCQHLKVPVIVKEVGSGIAPNLARRLIELGVSAIDIGGSGGTSWPYIEGLRHHSKYGREIGECFRSWGIPTAINLAAIRRKLGAKPFPITATGGIRSGLMVAGAVALGADMVGVGLPLLRAAVSDDEEAVHQLLQRYIHELRITMLATGSKSLAQLGSALLPWSSANLEWIEALACHSNK